MRNTLSEMYQNIFDSYGQFVADEEEHEYFKDVQNELVEEELKWLVDSSTFNMYYPSKYLCI